MHNETFQLDFKRLEPAGREILATMTTIQNEHGYSATEVVAIALYVTGSALAQIGVVFPTDGAIDTYLAPLADGYRHSFATLAKTHAN